MSLKFVLAPDSFKESCTAENVCEAMEIGIRKVFPDANIIKVPMADGGEGTVHALVEATGGKILKKDVKGPLGNLVSAEYGILGNNKTAIIEMASASGIHLVKKEDRNPYHTTTFGTGELIKDCLDRGIRDIILGIGGSATNDGGKGMARALGIRFLNNKEEELPPGGGQLHELTHIDTSEIHPALAECTIAIATDVSNPLFGEDGASTVFGPQKGASPEMVSHLDNGLKHYASVIKKELNKDVGTIPGSGGAGGLGAGLLAFTNSTIEPGINLVIRYSELEKKLEGANYCFTGEGQIDFQTKFGKTPFGVMKTAKKICPEIKVVALAGSIGHDIDVLYEEGMDGVFSITPGANDLHTLLEEGFSNISQTTESICRLIK